MTYPSGRSIIHTPDAADQVTGMSGAFAGGTTPYASGIQYIAAGGVQSLPMGNGITETHNWNNLFEQTSVSAGNLSLGYNYCQNLATNSVCATTNTGSPFQQTIGWEGTQAVQQLAPDGVNRITSASEQQGSSTAWSRQYTYDNLGNMAQTPTPGGTTWTAGSFNSKNQVADPNWIYDNAGNVVGAGTGGPTLQYDGENRLVKACGSSSCTTFSYDAAGNRVQRTDSSSQSTTTTTFVYDAFGNLAADYGAPANAPGTQYVAVDAMGSTRLVMDGTAVERHDFEPYGAELSGGWRTAALGYSSATVRQRFTGQERDDDTTLDYFLARYYSGTQGRFGSPDPGNAGANPGDPQSWNGYAYVSGNPLTFTDPSGQFLEATAGGAAVGGPVGAAIGAAIDVGILLFGIFDGGGSKPDLSSVAFTPGPVEPLTGGADPDPYAAQSQAGGGGQPDPGSLFGGGSSGPFAFSATTTTGSATDIFSNWATVALASANPGATRAGHANTMPFPLIVGGARVATWATRLSGIGTVALLFLMQSGGSPQHLILKDDIKQVRQAARSVSKQPGCRAPEPDDFNTVHENIKHLKGPDGKVTWEQLIEEWRAVLCRGK